MKKLYELLRLNNTKGDFGLEIECEGENINVDCPNGWRVVNDGSLRGIFPHECCEFVFKKPQDIDSTIALISSLIDRQELSGAKFNFSFRTSVHVHVNCCEMSWGEYCAFVYSSLLLEDVLSNYCGDERKTNRFCLRVSDAEEVVNYVSNIFQMGSLGIELINENDIRYGFINIAATKKYGSLEFRGMRGTLDLHVLTTWVKAINNIREFAIKAGSPKVVHDKFVMMSPEEFLVEALGDVHKEFYYKSAITDVRKAFSLTLEVPYAYKEQKDVEEELPMKVKKPNRFANPYVLPDAQVRVDMDNRFQPGMWVVRPQGIDDELMMLQPGEG